MQTLTSSEKHDKKALIALPGALSVEALLKEDAVRIGYHVSTFSSNERIWAFFEKENPSLVVLGDGDLKGIDLCRNIRAHNAGRYTTILVVSTVKQTRTEEGYLEAGADNVLHISEDSTSVHGWIAAADRHATNLADLKQWSNKIESYQRELNFMNVQLEEMLTNTNKLAVEAELAYLALDQIFKPAAGGILVVDKSQMPFDIMRPSCITFKCQGGSKHVSGKEIREESSHIVVAEYPFSI
jgi:PleD family two-component response regulator